MPKQTPTKWKYTVTIMADEELTERDRSRIEDRAEGFPDVGITMNIHPEGVELSVDEDGHPL